MKRYNIQQSMAEIFRAAALIIAEGKGRYMCTAIDSVAHNGEAGNACREALEQELGTVFTNEPDPSNGTNKLPNARRVEGREARVTLLRKLARRYRDRAKRLDATKTRK